MTTQILKARQTGAGERQRVSEAIPQAQIYSACQKLKAALGAYQAAAAELQECQLKVARAQGDVEMIGDSALSEAESLEAINNAHGRKELYTSRIGSLERKVAGLLQGLRSGLVPAYNEVRNLIIRESERRIEILERRVTEVAGGFNEHSIIARGGLSGLVRQSKLVWAVERLLPGQLIGLGSMAGEAVVAESQSVLGSLEQIIPELGRVI